MIISIENFAKRHANADHADRAERDIIVRASGVPDLANSSGRMIRYLFSDPSVARDNHTIQTWLVDNFNRNPVFLWAHDTKQPPIGRVVDIEQSNGLLRGTVEYMDRDVYPFADVIFQMVRNGYLNAVSTSWDPLKWKLSSDRSRPGGIDFELVDLLEISQVPVPALPTALATARANGIDTGPIFDWAGRVLDEGGMTMIGRKELEELHKSAKMPVRASGTTKTLYVARPVLNHADIQQWMRDAGFSKSLVGEDMHVTVAFSRSDVDWSNLSPDEGELTIAESDARSVVPLGDKGAVVLRFDNQDLAARWQEFRDAGASWDFPEYHPHVTLTYSGAPEGVGGYDGPIVLGPERFREVNSNWASEITEVDLTSSASEPGEAKEARTMNIAELKRDICHVGWLAYVLSDLDCVEQSLEWEKAYNESDSTIPAQLDEVKGTLGKILIQLVGEEVAALLAGDGDDGERSHEAATLLRNHADIAMSRQAPPSRAGKMISNENARALQDAHDMIDRGCGMIRALLEKDASNSSNGASEDEDETARAIRSRRARALKRRVMISTE